MRKVHRNMHDGSYKFSAKGSFGTHSNQVPNHEELALSEFYQLCTKEVEEDVEDGEREVGCVLEEVNVK